MPQKAQRILDHATGATERRSRGEAPTFNHQKHLQKKTTATERQNLDFKKHLKKKTDATQPAKRALPPFATRKKAPSSIRLQPWGSSNV